ncbi:MAG: MarR family transcriptional regulator [Gammaproteobacteria bacterium]|nr:MAG: MarR family transcriptional regulator [Gammaproteobacteria bacterium]
MHQVDSTLISEVRLASRDLVRQFGLMNQNVAGTDLSLSAVHAIIEVGRTEPLTSKELSNALLLEKSTVSRMVRSLIERGEIREVRSSDDLRVKHLHLTQQGKKTLRSINAFAEAQVSGALGQLDDLSQRTVLKGLVDYSIALKNASAVTVSTAMADRLVIEHGYVPTIVGRIIELLLLHMNKHYGFGQAFESRIAEDLAEFVSRLDSPRNEMWRAESRGRIVGSISIDGEDLGDGLAHLRWFVVSEEIRGSGTGRTLLTRAIDFCDQHGFSEIHLWTVKGLDAARKLYESHGFELVQEYHGDQWGAEVIEHKYVRYRPELVN